MNSLRIEATRNTPTVEFKENGHLIIEGRAFSEDPRKFFQPLLEWCQRIESKEVSFEVKLDYLNTSSTKMMKEIIKTIDANSHIENKDIKWYYEEDDEDMLEVGQFIEEITFSSNFYYYDMIAA